MKNSFTLHFPSFFFSLLGSSRVDKTEQSSANSRRRETTTTTAIITEWNSRWRNLQATETSLARVSVLVLVLVGANSNRLPCKYCFAIQLAPTRVEGQKASKGEVRSGDLSSLLYSRFGSPRGRRNSSSAALEARAN